MAERLLIAFDAGGGYRWLRPELDQVSQRGNLEPLALAATDREALLLLPASWVLLVELDLPIKNSAQLRQALPFALEDKLADDVENHHLVWLRQANQRLAVAAVDKARLTDCLQTLLQAGIEPQAIYPEALCLPYRPEACSVLIEGDSGMLRYGQWQGGGIDLTGLPLLLQALRGQGLEWQNLMIWGDVDSIALADQQAWQVQPQASVDPLQLLATQIDQVVGMNLLTGEFAPQRTDEGLPLKRWLPALAIVLLALVLQLAAQYRANRSLREQSQQLDQQTQALFQQTFPDIKRIVNVRVQAEQRWQELQKQTQAGGEFMAMLQGVGQQLQQTPGLQWRGLSFGESGLQLRLLGEESQIQSYHQALSAAWLATLQVLHTTPQGVEAEIDVAAR